MIFYTTLRRHNCRDGGNWEGGGLSDLVDQFNLFRPLQWGPNIHLPPPYLQTFRRPCIRGCAKTSIIFFFSFFTFVLAKRKISWLFALYGSVFRSMTTLQGWWRVKKIEGDIIDAGGIICPPRLELIFQKLLTWFRHPCIGYLDGCKHWRKKRKLSVLHIPTYEGEILFDLAILILCTIFFHKKMCYDVLTI